LIDLADFPLPHLHEPVPPARGAYAGDHTKAWAARTSAFDGYVFVTPEYNRSIPGVLKHAIDHVQARGAPRPPRPLPSSPGSSPEPAR
jgi:NAD(P)H-dependent FMN reductase